MFFIIPITGFMVRQEVAFLQCS